MYYAASNSYATSTSIGFSNTWYVIAFPKKQDRDQFVNTAQDTATQKIKKNEISQFTGKPAPFSEDFLGIIYELCTGEELNAGAVGRVEVTNKWVHPQAERVW